MSVKALVIGAGPAGLGATLQLASWCEDTLVIEARPRASIRRAGEHLPPNALTMLAQLGLSEILEDPRHTMSSGVNSAWGEKAVAERDYFFSPVGHGINLRRDIFDEALTHRVEQSGARVNFDTRLVALKKTTNGYRATIRGPSGESDLSTDIVLDASGRNARAARKLGATLNRVDNLVGIVAQVKCKKPEEDAGRLHIEAVEKGWWYTVQFADGTLIATFMTDATNVTQHEQGALGVWQDHLATSRNLAQFVNSDNWPASTPNYVTVFDASTQSLQKMNAANFLAVGDAAVAFDPLSSWGITKGMLDGFEGAHALERQLSGEQTATQNHRSKQQNDFQLYRENRTKIYSAEQRWPESPFWRTRQTLSELH